MILFAFFAHSQRTLRLKYAFAGSATKANPLETVKNIAKVATRLRRQSDTRGPKNLLLTGAAGFVGGHILLRALENWRVIGLDFQPPPIFHARLKWHEIDLLDVGKLESIFQTNRPVAVIHTAAMSDIDACESNPDLATQLNVSVTEHLAHLCREFGSKLLFTSTDTIFAGTRSFYSEEDPPQPLNHYARTKVAAERIVLDLCPGSVVARLSLVAGLPAFSRGNSYMAKAVQALRAGQTIAFPDDEFRTPVYVCTAAEALLELADQDLSGIFHLAGNERLSRHETGCRLARKLKVDESLVLVKNSSQLPGRAPRPKDVSLSNTKARSQLQTPFLSFDATLEEMLKSKESSHA